MFPSSSVSEGIFPSKRTLVAAGFLQPSLLVKSVHSTAKDPFTESTGLVVKKYWGRRAAPVSNGIST
jgi:hypothetical protein